MLIGSCIWANPLNATDNTNTIDRPFHANQSHPQQLADKLDADQDDTTDRASVLDLKLEFGHTVVVQYASDVDEPANDLVTASFDVVGHWTLQNDPHQGTSVIGFRVEGADVVSHHDGEDLSANIGSVMGLNGDLDDQEIALTELWWSTSLGDPSLVLTIGKIDPTVYFDANRVANDETWQFLASPLVNNLAVPFPFDGLGVNVCWTASDQFYIQGGWSDGAADARETGFNTVDKGDWFAAVEMGLTPLFNDHQGNYRVMVWFSDLEDNGAMGVALSFDQEIGSGVVPFFRFGYADDDSADFDRFVSLGIGLEGPLGRPDDMVAFGIVWGRPGDGVTDEETMIELFYRAQMTPWIALTPDLQVVIDPADSDDNSAVVVLGLRLQTSF